MRYIIEFERVGRRRDVEPLYVLALNQAELCHAIRNHVRPHIRSRDFDVMIDEDGCEGWIACGMHSGGEFTIQGL